MTSTKTLMDPAGMSIAKAGRDLGIEGRMLPEAVGMATLLAT